MDKEKAPQPSADPPWLLPSHVCPFHQLPSPALQQRQHSAPPCPSPLPTNLTTVNTDPYANCRCESQSWPLRDAKVFQNPIIRLGSGLYRALVSGAKSRAVCGFGTAILHRYQEQTTDRLKKPRPFRNKAVADTNPTWLLSSVHKSPPTQLVPHSKLLTPHNVTSSRREIFATTSENQCLVRMRSAVEIGPGWIADASNTRIFSPTHLHLKLAQQVVSGEW